MTPSTLERVLITGATGFLGSWIVSALANRGIPVLATDISEDYHRLDALCPNPPEGMVERRICDITDPEALDLLIGQMRPTGIIHLAALQIPVCRERPAAGAAVNIGGHINIFEAARAHRIRRIIYTSSIAAKPRGSANAPSNLYGVFKKTDEEISRIYWQDHQLPSLGLRPYIVYGVGRDEGETSAITRAIEAAALGKKYEIPFDTRSCFQYVGDIAEIFVRAVRSDWRGALLSDISDRVQSTDDVLAAIRTVVPEAEVTVADTARVSPEDGFDTSPLRQVIGDLQETPLVEGVLKTVELYRAIDARRRQAQSA
ncbi:NAD-dependent epimerase/dehydratase family protein [Tateyamaria pelophila]|uniref:NAD-dependent epimerase/dehydratase family protein n=1 Tax=Tateyamaria pelophila TaxID=328415 RepID=UPI001CBAD02B|nr:NAD(P)-dependent oxidoreductase [Tateyamaria pelophila]